MASSGGPHRRPESQGTSDIHNEDAALPVSRGPRQQEIAEILLGAPEDGLKTADIARMVMEQPNAYLTLQK